MTVLTIAALLLLVAVSPSALGEQLHHHHQRDARLEIRDEEDWDVVGSVSEVIAFLPLLPTLSIQEPQRGGDGGGSPVVPDAIPNRAGSPWPDGEQPPIRSPLQYGSASHSQTTINILPLF